MAFGNYSKQAPQQGKTVSYPLRCFRNPDGSSPSLKVEHLGESNRPFWLETLAKAKADRGRIVGDTPTEIDRERRNNRDDNRETLIDHSARHVENAFHDDGAAASDKDIRAIVMAMPDPDFDLLFAYVQNHGNYRDFSIAEEPAALAEK